jgi:hypothetical protein
MHEGTFISFRPLVKVLLVIPNGGVLHSARSIIYEPVSPSVT